MKIKDLWNSVLRILLAFFGLNVFTACYGPASYMPYVSVNGKVVDETDNPVCGIKVTSDIEGRDGSNTDSEGRFGTFFSCDAKSVPETITYNFTDPDGPDNGGEFEDKTVVVNLKEQAAQSEPLVVRLTLKK